MGSLATEVPWVATSVPEGAATTTCDGAADHAVIVPDGAATGTGEHAATTITTTEGATTIAIEHAAAPSAGFAEASAATYTSFNDMG